MPSPAINGLRAPARVYKPEKASERRLDMSTSPLRSFPARHYRPLFLKILESRLKRGTVSLWLPDGKRYRVGHGKPEVEWIFHDLSALGKIWRNPELQMGETYMEGAWDAGKGGLPLLLHVLIGNLQEERKAHGLETLGHLFGQHRRSKNGIRRSYDNVSHHYDQEEWLFRCFLDEDMQYSCAYFARPDMSLEEAQQAKLELLRKKLCTQPGDRILDIGSGWGGLALYLAEHGDVEVTGLTLSREQLHVSRERAAARGLSHRVRFLLQDYREHSEQYDRIVSVGMFEHVGQEHYPRFFQEMKRRLKKNGLALLHTIGRSGPPAAISEWVDRYIFPGSHIPSLSEVSRAVEDNHLVTTDLEVLRLHYAKTLACWWERFGRRRAEIRLRLGERFCRMWEFYLASSEASFRGGDLVVFQLQLGHTNQAAPLTRDYLWGEGEPFASAKRMEKRRVRF